MVDFEEVQSDPVLNACLGSFLRYSTYRIREQSLPSFFDGLLPGQRRLMFSLQDLGAFHDKKHQKSSRVVAQTTAAYHPVGGASVYGTLVNMSQPYRVPLLLTDPEGNWGEPENGTPAAERYTEIRLSLFGESVLYEDHAGERISSQSSASPPLAVAAGITAAGATITLFKRDPPASPKHFRASRFGWRP